MKIFFEGLTPEFTKKLRIESTNFRFTSVIKVNDCEIRVVVDPKKNERLISSRDIVILAEPEVVRPDLYTKKFINGAVKILPLGRYRADRLGLKNWINFPVSLPSYKKARFLREKNFALVNEHKFSSSYRSNYGLRRKTILYFESKQKLELDVYGNEWNIGKYLEIKRRFYQLRNSKNFLSVNLHETFSDLWVSYGSTKGHMHQDCEGLQNYKVNICIENDSDYISEKVWKALYAGAVPLYVGPNLIFDTELKESVIYCTPDIADIIDKIESIDSNLLEEKRKYAKDFLNSVKFQKYSLDRAVTCFYTQLNQILSSSGVNQGF